MAVTGWRWALANHPVEALAALAQLEPGDLDGVVTAPIFEMAVSLADLPADVLPETLRERLSEGERNLFERAARLEAAPAPSTECVTALRRLRLAREKAAVQEEIAELDRTGGEAGRLETARAAKTRLARRGGGM